MQEEGKGYEEKLNYEGPIGYNDEKGTYFKWGIYKYPWRERIKVLDEYMVYYDEIRIGDQSCSFSKIKLVD